MLDRSFVATFLTGLGIVTARNVNRITRHAVDPCSHIPAPEAGMVFIIDDCSDDRALVLHELKAEFPDMPVHEIGDAEEQEAAFTTMSPSLVVTDLTLGWTTGFDVLARAKSLFPNCPVIMYTGTGDEEAAVEGMKAGLDDYVVKDPRRLERLRGALREAMKRDEARD